MIAEMGNVAAECFRNPRKRSVWSAELGRYVCPESDDGKAALARLETSLSPQKRGRRRLAIHPSTQRSSSSLLLLPLGPSFF